MSRDPDGAAPLQRDPGRTGGAGAPLEIALKVDVCNRRSLLEGVPGLLDLLASFGVRASFFVAFGPDNSGKAIRRIFRRGFLKKMIRTRAPRMYGYRTLLYGTLLPAPPVGEAAPDLLRRAEAAGHEVGLHSYDHVGWQDGLARMTEPEVRASYLRGVELCARSLGYAPRFSGAAGWQVSAASLRVQEELGLTFASDCREGRPFYPEVAGERLETLQIPTGLLTSDEVLGAGRAAPDDLARYYLERLEPDRVNVLGLHAEAEGIHFSEWLRQFLAAASERGAAFRLLSEVAERERERAPARRVVSREIPGRAGTVACPDFD
jgi:peptidoglycan/xylan/chitin deacetylase (PgdA/CDA1 family)